jgi:hypothetical protein
MGISVHGFKYIFCLRARHVRVPVYSNTSSQSRPLVETALSPLPYTVLLLGTFMLLLYWYNEYVMDTR